MPVARSRSSLPQDKRAGSKNKSARKNLFSLAKIYLQELTKNAQCLTVKKGRNYGGLVSLN